MGNGGKTLAFLARSDVICDYLHPLKVEMIFKSFPWNFGHIKFDEVGGNEGTIGVKVSS